MRALRSGLMAAMSISIFIMVFSNHTLSETTQPNLRIRAQSVILMDAISGQILYEQTPRLKIAPASFVKILTLHVAFDAIRAGDLKMDDVVTVSQVELIAAEDGRVAVTKGEEKLVSVNSVVPSFIDAPIRKGQQVGKVLIQSGGKVFREVDLLSSSDVPKGFPFLWLLIGGGILGLLLVGLIAFLRMFRSPRKRIR